jgi:very-short-patch-repair endonuclease
MDTTDAPRPRLTISASVESRLQLAGQQRRRPLLHNITITNTSATDAVNLTLHVAIDPAVAAPMSVPIDRIPAESAITLPANALPMPLSVDRLVAQTEREDGFVRIWIEGEASAAPLVENVQVLAFDEWPGAAAPPDLIASFVTPNHAGTADMLGHVRSVLSDRRQTTTLEGYQAGDPARVQELAAAVYGSIAHAGITYANPPASFEQSGQRVRTTDRMLTECLATCLDLTLGMCAAMEQIGLHTMVIIVSGHAYPAVWLRETMLPQTWTDEPSLIRNRIELGELLAFDSSAAANGMEFSRACAEANRSLREDVLVAAIDIAACRSAQIRPLPLRAGAAPERVVSNRGAGAADVDSGTLPALPVGPSLRADAFANEAPNDRLRRWKERLLDMSLNNRLINQKRRKSTLPLLSQDPAGIEDALHTHASLQLAPKSAATASDDLVEAGNQAIRQGTLLIDMTERELFNSATELYRSAKTLEDDSGVVPLYLALGSLRWYESASSSMERRAPILLVPVSLRRDSVRGPFRIRRTDEDPQVNVAMLKKLETDFGVPTAGLDSLPEDDKGIDVAAVLQNIRFAIKDLPRFEVLSEVTLDLFSFAKFLMWSDLEQNVAALANNTVVQRLLNPDAPAIVQPAAFSAPQDLDRTRAPADDLSVVDADSSQLAATWSALDGNTFILQGPPGTGKSQTITNLIAMAAGAGKTVLFVAEKRAALEVVERRLEKVGLGAFVLEAHSDKGTRGEVVKQLGEPLTYAWEKPSGEWERSANELGQMRAELNAHAKRLNTPGPWGESLQQTLGRLIELNEAPKIQAGLPAEPNREQVASYRQHVRGLQAEAGVVGNLSQSPWRGFDPREWTPAGQAQLESLLERGTTQLVSLSDAWTKAAAVLNVDAGDARIDQFLNLNRLLLAAPPGVRAALLQERPTDMDARLAQLEAKLQEREVIHQRVATALQPTIYGAAELDDWRARLARWANAFFLIRFFMLFGLRGAIKRHAVAALPSPPDLQAHVEQAAQVRALDETLTTQWQELSGYFGTELTTVGHNLNGCRTVAKWASALRAVRIGLQLPPAAESRIALLASEADEQLAQGSPQRLVLEALNTTNANWLPTLEALVSALRPTRPDWLAGALSERVSRLRALWDSTSSLRDWAVYRSVARAAGEAGLAPFVQALEGGILQADELSPAFERSIRDAWVNHRFEVDEALRSFRGARHQAIVDRFRQLDKASQDLARREIQARLASRLPDPSAPGQMDTIRRELKKKRGHQPVRKLFTEVRDVLARLKPVVLMSPLTVARHLDPSLPPFDMVIFDEASQIPPWDAIGALARGRQAVVVGDSKQLPPTSFFSKETTEETDDDERIDLESILDHAGACGMPEILLGWHYRSKHENLIAFSNHQYYNNRLFIFPSPYHDTPQLGVKWKHVPTGVYDRGGARDNKAEAQAVVNAIVLRSLNPATAHKSIGVVTFSQAQQRCVEDLLDDARRNNPALETALLAQHEPLFVKNLENVQGDERDVMLFSIGYAADQHGKLTMAFGPLNREGGERRLNVAVTRGRELLEVYSTLRPEQIDLSRTGALGVQHLKTFLEYAARGPSVLGQTALVDPDADYGSPFEEQVATRLQTEGWKVQTQVGVAGYRIDLAVVHPELSGAYVLAIECDGAAYHSAATARDRDRLRQGVLEMMGWRFFRIWSTDWWHEPERVMVAMREALKEAMAQPPIGSVDMLPMPAAEAVHAGERPETIPADNVPAVLTVPETPALPPRIENVFDTAEVPSWPEYATPYTGLMQISGGFQESFYEATRARVITKQLEQVVEQSSPVSVAHLTRHITRAWGFSSTSSAANDYVMELAGRSPELTVAEDAVVWGALPNDGRRFAYAGDNDPGDRKFEELSLVELSAALQWIVERAVSVSEDDAYRELARVFGVGRVGKNVRAVCERAAGYAVSRGVLGTMDGQLRVVADAARKMSAAGQAR